jgi:hypothetical protein
MPLKSHQDLLNIAIGLPEVWQGGVNRQFSYVCNLHQTLDLFSYRPAMFGGCSLYNAEDRKVRKQLQHSATKFPVYAVYR